MDLSQVVQLVLAIALIGGLICLFLWIYLWIPAHILHKAGFPRWLVIPLQVAFPISWVVFALADWPIQREVAWLRMKAGEFAGDRIALVEAHAIDLENAGEWKTAIEVYEELARRAPNPEGADYYRNCSERLLERMAENKDA